jgi:RNA polymerase sigma factor (sigma-70 family)
MELLTAAAAGDEQAFVQLTAPLRRRLHAHCNRMLGSVHDADDALQETMLRAWRGIGRFEPRAELSSWLYRIATNVCLRMIDQRDRRSATVDAHLQPYPDVLLEQQTPEREAERRETIGLAFVAAMQLLPPRQRAALVLRTCWAGRHARPPRPSASASRRRAARCSGHATESSASVVRARSHACTGRPTHARRRSSCAASSTRGKRSTSSA